MVLMLRLMVMVVVKVVQRMVLQMLRILLILQLEVCAVQQVLVTDLMIPALD